MNVSLNPELDRYVQDKVASGSYNSASEVIREALRLLQHEDAVREAKLAALKADLQIGINQLDRGEGIDGIEFLNSLISRNEEARRKAS